MGQIQIIGTNKEFINYKPQDIGVIITTPLDVGGYNLRDQSITQALSK
jgi:hypothetical protein